MPLPALDTASRRNLLLGGLLALLLLVPTVLGLAVAGAGESHPPSADQQATDATAPRTTLQVDQSQVVSEAPLANAPETALDALTRTGEEALGIARITFESSATGRLRVENGGSVPLAGGYEIRVTIDPYPPNRFDLHVQLEILQNDVAVSDATIDTVWDMTLMGHGPFDTRLTPLGDGAYEADFDFFMFGPWAVDATASMPGAPPLEFSLSFYVWPS